MTFKVGKKKYRWKPEVLALNLMNALTVVMMVITVYGIGALIGFWAMSL